MKILVLIILIVNDFLFVAVVVVVLENIIDSLPGDIEMLTHTHISLNDD